MDKREVIKLVPYLKHEEAAKLLARISPIKGNVLQDMLHGLIFTTTHCHSNGETIKFKQFLTKTANFQARDLSKV